MMNSTKQHISNLNTISTQLPALIASLDLATTELARRMHELEKQGLIYATEHWKDRKYMMLLYPIKPGKPRQREYVGNDETKVKDAQAKIQRAKDFDALAEQAKRIDGALTEALRHLRNATQVLSRG